ncbi:hypothetical protein ABC418_08620 [Lactiplantibacillus plantarum]|uniref:hypothetical protein n=1 Tax=Lactiplantibacillus plantarum TaxID=1590 RepID=UPI003965CB02
MTDTEYVKAIQTKATVANLEMNAALTTEQQAQIGQDFIADIVELGNRDSKIVAQQKREQNY